MIRQSTTTSSSAATMLHAMLVAGALLATTTRALAHEDPPGCSQSGPAIVTSVFRADGTTALVGAVSECETIHYRATLRKALDDDAICAFFGGTFTLTTPDGVVHTIEAEVPCIGGTIAPCDPSVDLAQSELVAYTVRSADVAGGLVIATATYAGGFLHDSGVDSPGVGAITPKATPVVACDDGDACTQNVCDPNAIGEAACSNPPVDCNDDNACTNDGCSEGECTNVAPDPTCVPCETAEDCNDGNACTTDLCVEGICTHETPDPTCVPCETAADCNDDDVCTTERCTEGVCGHTAVSGCIPCQVDGDCDDGDACTSDVCGADKSCQITSIPGCPAEICDDRIDNDGDGAVDCADTDCAGNAACTPELCGNCLDDDGDGDVDYEDADCCDNASNLDLRRMAVRTKPVGGKNRLRVKARYASRAPEGFDPGLLGTTLQLRDDQGLFFCQNIPFKSDAAWTRMGVFKFKDKTGAMAAGLRKARFKIHRKTDGHVSFRTKGKKMQFREPAGTQVEVTLRVGAQCTQATASLKTKRVRTGKRLVFP